MNEDSPSTSSTNSSEPSPTINGRFVEIGSFDLSYSITQFLTEEGDDRSNRDGENKIAKESEIIRQSFQTEGSPFEKPFLTQIHRNSPSSSQNNSKTEKICMEKYENFRVINEDKEKEKNSSVKNPKDKNQLNKQVKTSNPSDPRGIT